MNIDYYIVCVKNSDSLQILNLLKSALIFSRNAYTSFNIITLLFLLLCLRHLNTGRIYYYMRRNLISCK